METYTVRIPELSKLLLKFTSASGSGGPQYEALPEQGNSGEASDDGGPLEPVFVDVLPAVSTSFNNGHSNSDGAGEQATACL